MNLLWLYSLLHYFLTPFLKLWIYIRLLRKKEDPARFRERFGRTRLKRPAGRLFWFHGASNGECLSFLSLIRRYQEEYPQAHFLITSQTLTSSELVKIKLPKRSMHQFLPVDHPIFVKRFLDHWQPDVVFWTESELWPNILHKVSEKSPLILLNGRLSDRTYKLWKMVPEFSKSFLEKFSLIFCQSKEDLEKFTHLGAKHLHYAGNLKFSGRPLDANTEKLKELKSSLKNRPLWAASCTHPGEEEIILQAHALLKKSIDNIITIIVPRHPHRAEKLRQTWEAQGMKVAQRSHQEEPKANTDILLFDVTGELGLIYRVCPITLVAGSLVEGIGGHNPLEAANLKSAICLGPYTKNNQEIYEALKKEGACKVVNTPKQIAKTVLSLIENPKERDALIKKSFSFSKNQQSVLERIIEEVEKAGVLS
jgi:3-deoxy-D-manno-octulosonic-acid transferase